MRKRHLIPLLLPLAGLLHLSACANRDPELVALVKLKLPVNDEILGIVTVDGLEVDFDLEAVNQQGRRVIMRSTAEIRTDTLFARVDGEPYEIALRRVSDVRLARSGTQSTPTALLVGVAILVGVPLLVGRLAS